MSAKTTLLGWAESITIRLAYYTDRLDTYTQTKAGAARYREGPGKTPTKAEMQRYRAMASDLRVTDEYFDYLKEEADRPARTPDPKTVALFRRYRCTHR